MLKLLHISDIHLNTGFSSKNETVRTALKTGLLEALEEAFAYVIETNIEGIIIAGDFFDHDQISFAIEHYVVDLFEKVLKNNTHIFYVTGNHDPMHTSTFFSTYAEHPYFHMFDGDVVKHMELISKEGVPYHVVGCGHKSKNEKRNLIKTFPVKEGEGIWIGIGHASVPSAISIREKESYMAAPLSDIEALNYNYFALGHIHIRQQFSERIAYSGNIQGLNIKETGEKGGYLVSLTPERTELTDLNFQRIRWEQIDISVPSEMHTLAELQSLVVEEISEKSNTMRSGSKQLIFRVYLVGKSRISQLLKQSENVSYLEELIREKTGLLDVEIKTQQLTNVFDVNRFMRENTLLAYILKLINDDDYDEILMSRLLDLPVFDKRCTKEDVLSLLGTKKSLLLEELIERMVNEVDEN